MIDTAYAQPLYIGCLEGHRDWVTSIQAIARDPNGSIDVVASGSRDKKVMVWKIEPGAAESKGQAGYALRALSGHAQTVQDLSLSHQGKYAVTASWDHTMRLWDIETGATIRHFIGHTSDVNSVALSFDNRQVVSGSRDKTLRLWNVLADCKYTINQSCHMDWVSCARFSPLRDRTLIVSGGWDKLIKVWNLCECSLKSDLVGHSGAVYSVAISPDGSLCASGGKDGIAMLWDVNEGNHLYSISAMSPINALCFSPCHYWLCAATDTSIKIWNLENKKNVIADIVLPKTSYYDEEGKAVQTKAALAGAGIPSFVSLTWSTNGEILYAGSTDGRIYLYAFEKD